MVVFYFWCCGSCIYDNKIPAFNKNGSVAQLEERDVNTVKVLGSSPGRII